MIRCGAGGWFVLVAVGVGLVAVAVGGGPALEPPAPVVVEASG